MRIADFVVAATVVAGMSGVAQAQTPSTPPAPSTPTTYTTVETHDHWIASAFVGSNFGSGRPAEFGSDDSESSFNFGGQVGYLWSGIAGLELLTDFAPSFDMASLLLADHPAINTYMVNGVAAVPLGEDRQVLPYFSGGVGAVQMSSTFFALDPALAVAPGPISAIDTVDNSETRLGLNVGGGLMAYAGHIGFRGDLRYYKTTVDDVPNSTSPQGLISQSILSGLAFWKVNAGVAFRW